MYRASLLAVAASLVLSVPAADAQIFGGQPRSSAQRAQDRQISQVPRCARSLGTLTIADGDPAAYDALQLQPPHTLLRLVVQRSGCFTLVDRGNAAMSAIERERALASAGELQQGSNVGPGQIRAADYVLVAEVASENANASGGGFRGNVQSNQNNQQAPRRGGLLGGGLGGLGGLVGGASLGGGVSLGGGMNSQTGEANTVLSVVSVRTAETLAASQGYAAKRDVTWNLAGAATLGGIAGGGYETTEIGRIVAQSFINAYSELVEQLNALEPESAAGASAYD